MDKKITPTQVKEFFNIKTLNMFLLEKSGDIKVKDIKFQYVSDTDSTHYLVVYEVI